MSDYSDVYSFLADECHFPTVDGYEFYSFIFPNIESAGDHVINPSSGISNPIYLYYDSDYRKLKRRIMLEDTFEEDYYEYVDGNTMTLCSGLTYFGRANRLEHASCMNALIFDIDAVGYNEIRNFHLRWNNPVNTMRSVPLPTFVVLSGSGVHLYYVFDKPIELYPNIKIQLKSMKHALTYRFWDYGCTSKMEDIQFQSINQSFRMVGSYNTKNPKESHKIVAFKTGERVSIDFLNQYAAEKHCEVDLDKKFNPTKDSLEESKIKYPEWYQKVIVEGKKANKWDISGKVHGDDPYALYHWWIKHGSDITGGHRYFFLMCMAIYAQKCDVPKATLIADMKGIFNEIAAIAHDNPLTEYDMKSALEAYDREYCYASIDVINAWSGLSIKKNRRNGKPQALHLDIMRYNKAQMKKFQIPFKNPEGRPSKKELVQDYKKNNPDSNPAMCSRDLNISYPTAWKWWNS